MLRETNAPQAFRIVYSFYVGNAYESTHICLQQATMKDSRWLSSIEHHMLDYMRDNTKFLRRVIFHVQTLLVVGTTKLTQRTHKGLTEPRKF